ncbi:DUF488 domain-containing protein [Nocardia alni]|uniref:DUF488 domain-containing protein n=1 Tax=Nocardia alni TaxID=2815723 RepID=UPI001C21AC3E|nr:DUF488 family protein [Nocardia alni]
MTDRPLEGERAFEVKRVYDRPEDVDGRRVLVDRLWPRGVGKQQARIDDWMKAVAPSAELRRWFHADPGERRAEFARRYRDELADDEHRQALDQLRELADVGHVTLITAVKDIAHSHIPVLLERLRD